MWLAAKNIPLRETSRKLARRFICPYEIETVISSAAVQLKLPVSWRIHPTFHISQVKSVHHSPLYPPSKPPPSEPPPLARLINGDPAYMVRRIVEARRCRWGWQYLVDWEGYGSEDCLRIPWSFILDQSLVADFHDSSPWAAIQVATWR